jgi:[acyl-carrier-protein] S-malonyltransferase
MKAYIFPGQGAQFTGMGLDLYNNSQMAHELFEKANEILGFRIFNNQGREPLKINKLCL